MTEIRIVATVKYPTEKINDETIEPLLKEFREKTKEWMEQNLPEGKKITMSRIKKKDKLKQTYPDNWEKKHCPICEKSFKTAHHRRYCGNCRLDMIRTRTSASDLYIKLHPELTDRLDKLGNIVKRIPVNKDVGIPRPLNPRSPHPLGMSRTDALQHMRELRRLTRQLARDQVSSDEGEPIV